MSPGTARTMAESLRLGQRGGRVRRNGMIEEVPLAHSWRRVDFEGGSATAIAIAWGDIATAWFSTGIPNIETCVKVPFAIAIAGPALNWVRPLLASAPGQKVLHQLAKRSRGPNEKELRMDRSRLWGEVRNAAGEKRTARLETANGYWLTVNGTLMAVEFLLKNALPGGYYTPSMLMDLDAWIAGLVTSEHMATSAASAPAPDASSARVAARPITPIFLRCIGTTLVRRIEPALEKNEASPERNSPRSSPRRSFRFRMTTSRRRGAARKRLSWHSRSST